MKNIFLPSQNNLASASQNTPIKYEVYFDDASYAVIKHIEEACYYKIEGAAYSKILDMKDHDLLLFCEAVSRNKRANSSQKANWKSKVLFLWSPKFFALQNVWRLYPGTGVVALTILVAVLAVIICLLSIEAQLSPTWFLVFWFIVNIFLHETGHLTACLAAGRTVGGVGIKINYACPVFFVKTSDICMTSKADRIRVSLGGVFFNSLLYLAALPIMLFLFPQFLSSATIISASLIILNLLPFIKLDGYHVLCAATNKSNLDEKSWDVIKRWFTQKKLSTTNERFVLVYAFLLLIFIIIAALSVTGNIARFVFSFLP